MPWIVILVLLVLLAATLPTAPWGTFHSLGYTPSGILALVLVVLIVLALTGRL